MTFHPSKPGKLHGFMLSATLIKSSKKHSTFHMTCCRNLPALSHTLLGHETWFDHWIQLVQIFKNHESNSTVYQTKKKKWKQQYEDIIFYFFFLSVFSSPKHVFTERNVSKLHINNRTLFRLGKKEVKKSGGLDILKAMKMFNNTSCKGW